MILYGIIAHCGPFSTTRGCVVDFVTSVQQSFALKDTYSTCNLLKMREICEWLYLAILTYTKSQLRGTYVDFNYVLMLIYSVGIQREIM